MATDKIRFMINNRAESTTGIYSSQDASFPFSNTLNARRSEYWKMTGHFETLVSNQVIYFNDGADQQANIVLGNYTTNDLFAAAVQTALNSVSTNWTVVFDSLTGYFTVDRTSGTKILRVSQTANACWDLIGFTGSIDINAGKADEKRWHDYESVLWDFGAAVNCSFFAAIFKSGSDFPFTSSATIKVQANNINNWVAPPVDETVTVSSNGIFHFLADTDTNYRFFRIYIKDRQGKSGQTGFGISHIYVGDYRTMDATNITVGFQKVIVDPSTSKKSIGGQEYFRENIKYHEFNGMGILHLTTAERARIETIFSRIGRHDPFYLSIDPTLCVTSDISDLTKIVRWSINPTLQHLIKDRFNLGITAREVL